MALGIWPTSPVPADMTRDINWGEASQMYDSGQEQGSTPWIKPLLKYNISLKNIPRTKQRSLHAFYANVTRGKLDAFLFSDPYDNRINGAVAVYSGYSASSFFVRTAEGYPVIPVSGTLLLTSNNSGALTQGTHYQFNADTGVFSTGLTLGGDTWTASCQYFRKCKFESYSEKSEIWDQFSGQVVFHEIALP